MSNALNITQVSTRDVGGGAERVAWDLFRTYRARGHNSKLVVGYRRGDDPDVAFIPNERAGGARRRLFWTLHRRTQPYYDRTWWARSLCRLTHGLAEPAGLVDTLRGLEDFHYPGSRHLTAMTSPRPDILHCHNLHGRYFDLSALPSLSSQVPTVLTLHDAWLLSGHCAHCLTCGRWREGCGECPDLTLYPAIRRDTTALNWRRKQRIFRRCRLHIATPCAWLMRKVRSSMLMSGVVDARIIPYGIDLSVFHPSSRQAARERLDIPLDAMVLLFAANSIRKNAWKDYGTLRDAVARVGRRSRVGRLLFIALGEDAPPERVGDVTVEFVPYINDPRFVARYYQAADLYIHAARADTFPNTILEALACGTPVVATAVGGIPEQIKPLAGSPFQGDTAIASYSPDRATGVLVDPGNAPALAAAVEQLTDEKLRRRLGDNAAADAAARFDLQRHADAYLAWYHELLNRGESPEPRTSARAKQRSHIVA